MNILHVDSSILGEASTSRTLTRKIVEALSAAEPGARVRSLDLARQPLPHFSAESLSAAEPEAAERDQDLLNSFLQADVVVLGVPLYNFGVPSQLKSWIDRIVIKGRTFRYTATGPEGLAGGKRVIVALARGGVYAPDSGTEFAESYLRFLFGFLGITDLTFVRAEGLNISAEHRTRALEHAGAAIRALGTSAAPALAA
jgi:FMN-dependent NADH-azoreductase